MFDEVIENLRISDMNTMGRFIKILPELATLISYNGLIEEVRLENGELELQSSLCLAGGHALNIVVPLNILSTGEMKIANEDLKLYSGEDGYKKSDINIPWEKIGNYVGIYEWLYISEELTVIYTLNEVESFSSAVRKMINLIILLDGYIRHATNFDN